MCAFQRTDFEGSSIRDTAPTDRILDLIVETYEQCMDFFEFETSGRHRGITIYDGLGVDDDTRVENSLSITPDEIEEILVDLRNETGEPIYITSLYKDSHYNMLWDKCRIHVRSRINRWKRDKQFESN